MSQFLNVVRWQNKIRAMMGIDGENPIPTLAELLPVVVVESDRPEWGFAGNELRYMHMQSIAAGGAGTNSVYAVLNPTNSGVIGVIELIDGLTTIYVASLAEATVLANYTQAPVTETPRDTRLFGAARSALQIWTRNTAVGPQFVYRINVGGRTPALMIHPGFAYLFYNPTQNAATEVGVTWRERAQESGKQS